MPRRQHRHRHRVRLASLLQQSTAVSVVALVGLSAVGVVEIDVVPPVARGEVAASAPGRPAPVLQAPVPRPEREPSEVATAPVEPTVREVALEPAPHAAGRLGSADQTEDHGTDEHGTDDHGTEAHEHGPVGDPDELVTVTSAPQRAPGFATVGVTWSPGQSVDEDDLAAEVRTLQDGRWSEWEEMHLDADHAPDPGESPDPVRGGTDAVVVGDVDRVQVRVTGRVGRTPSDLELAIIDPGSAATSEEEPAIDTGRLDADPAAPANAADATETTGATGAATASATLSSAVAQQAAALSAPRPRIFSRAQWGADESLRDRGSLRYGVIRGAFVHHTVNANTYSRDEVPGLLRGIYAYHTRSLGWSDVGYNFLVDRFGRIWEGRAGGVGRAVVGAHTLGYNEESFAMSAIGNFETTRPTSRMLDAYARLFAWKLSKAGVRADDPSVRIAGDSFRAISGHRDAGSTACPGRYLYEKLGTIRSRTATLQTSGEPAPEPPPEPPAEPAPDHLSDISGRGTWPDLVARDSRTGRAVVVRTGGQLSYPSAGAVATGWTSADLVVAAGDLDGNDVGDVVARSTSGQARLYRGTARGTLSADRRTFTQLARLDQLTGVGDFDGDGNADLVGRVADNGALRLYPGLGNGELGASRKLSDGWRRYDLTAGAGDLDGDGRMDLVARTGTQLHLVRGTRTGVRPPVVLPGDWSGFDVVAGRGDATGDGHPDLVVREKGTGRTWIRPGDGAGAFGKRLGGWTSFAGLSDLALGGQLVGSRKPDLMGLAPNGELRVFRNSGQTNVARTVVTDVDLSAADRVVTVGDWNDDGHGDFMARQGSTMMFYAGRGDDTFAAPVRAGEGWDAVGVLTAVGDVTGDGLPDLLGRTAGSFRVYPGDGRSGFRAAVPAGSTLAASGLAGVGRFGGERPAVVLRRSGGVLTLVRTDRTGRMTGSTQVDTGAARYDALLGLGEANGRGTADLLARQRSTGDLWILPGSRSGFGERRLVGTGFGRYDLMG